MEEGKRSTEIFILSHDLQRDDDVLNMEPTVKVRPKIAYLDEKALFSVAKVNIYNQVQVRYCCQICSTRNVLCSCYHFFFRLAHDLNQRQ